MAAHKTADDHGHAPSPATPAAHGLGKQGWVAAMFTAVVAMVAVIPAKLMGVFGNHNARDAVTGGLGEWFEDGAEKLVRHPGPWLKKNMYWLRPFFQNEKLNILLSEFGGFLVKEGFGKHQGAFFLGELLTRGWKGVGEAMSDDEVVNTVIENIEGRKVDGKGDFCFHCSDSLGHLQKDGEIFCRRGQATYDASNRPKLSFGTAREVYEACDADLCPHCTPDQYWYFVRVLNPSGKLPVEETKPVEDHDHDEPEKKGIGGVMSGFFEKVEDGLQATGHFLNPNAATRDKVEKKKERMVELRKNIARNIEAQRAVDPTHWTVEQYDAKMRATSQNPSTRLKGLGGAIDRFLKEKKLFQKPVP